MTESWTTVNLLPASSRFRSTLGAADDDVMFFEDENWESHIKSQKTTSNFPFGDWISIMFTKIYTTYIIYIICLECICKMCFLDISIIYTIHTHIYIYIYIDLHIFRDSAFMRMDIYLSMSTWSTSLLNTLSRSFSSWRWHSPDDLAGRTSISIWTDQP